MSACGFCRRDIGGQRQDEAFQLLLKFPASLCEFLRAELTKSTSLKYFTTAKYKIYTYVKNSHGIYYFEGNELTATAV